MQLVLLVCAAAMIVGIMVYTVIYRYATLRSVRVMTALIGLLASVPLLLLSLYVLLLGNFDPPVKMWALGICGILAGFWLKSPLKNITDES